MQPEQQDIMLSFIEETQENLETIERGLLDLRATVQDYESFSKVVRATHTIKGASGMLDLHSMRAIATKMEDALKIIQAHPVAVNQTTSDLLFKGLGALTTLMVDLQQDLILNDAVAQRTVEKMDPVFATLEQHLADLRTPQSAARQPVMAGQPARGFSLTRICTGLFMVLKTTWRSLSQWIQRWF